MPNYNGMLLQFWEWFKNLLPDTSAFSAMDHRSNDSKGLETVLASIHKLTLPVVTPAHTQSIQQRQDDEVAIKRHQKKSPGVSIPTPTTQRKQNKSITDMRSQKKVPVQAAAAAAPRSRSAGYSSSRRAAALDYSGCQTDAEIEQRNEDFFGAPPLTLGNKGKSSKYAAPLTPESMDGHQNVEITERDSIQDYRRHSDPNVSPRTPELTPPPLNIWARRSVGKVALKRSDDTAEVNLDDRMKTLLLTPEEEKSKLHPSKYVIEKRTRAAEERRIKEIEAAVKAAEDDRKAAIKAAKELRLKRRSPLRPLVQPLNSHWENEVANTVRVNPRQVITTAFAGNDLHGKDFHTLIPQTAWLNDEIVNTYIDWVLDAANKADVAEAKARGETPSKVPRFMSHNSFFYPDLLKKGAASTLRLMKRKKAPGTDLLEVDTLFVPICSGNHWTVGVIRPVARTIEYFDSFGGSGTRFVDEMRKFLKFHLGDTYIDEEWKVPLTGCANQSNGYDCGVFVCTNVLCVALGLDTSCYEERDLSLQRRNIAAVLINRGFTDDFAWGRGL